MLTAGQDHESTVVDAILIKTDEELVDENGNRLNWPNAISGDKGYRADWIDDYLVGLGITPVIPSKENEDRGSRLVPFDKKLYRKRCVVEQLIGWLKESRRVFSRFEKTAINYGGFIKIAFIQRYLRQLAT